MKKKKTFSLPLRWLQESRRINEPTNVFILSLSCGRSLEPMTWCARGSTSGRRRWQRTFVSKALTRCFIRKNKNSLKCFHMWYFNAFANCNYNYLIIFFKLGNKVKKKKNVGCCILQCFAQKYEQRWDQKSCCLYKFQKNGEEKEVAEETCVYLKESLMPNTVLTLMYNIGKSGEDRKRHMKYNTNHVVLYNQLSQTASACVVP